MRIWSWCTLVATWMAAACTVLPPPALPACGNGIVDPGEACDGASHCTVACTCADGFAAHAGTCLGSDGGNGSNGSGSSGSGSGSDGGGSDGSGSGSGSDGSGSGGSGSGSGGSGSGSGSGSDGGDGSDGSDGSSSGSDGGDGSDGSDDSDECATDNGGCGPADEFTCHNTVGGPPTCTPISTTPVPRRIAGVVHGLTAGHQARVLLGNDGYLESRVVDAGGAYAFDDVPDGNYFLKVDVDGYATPAARTVVVAASAARPLRPAAEHAGQDAIDLDVTALPTNVFTYAWQEDPSRSGHQDTAHINQPPVIEFLDGPVDTPDLAAATTLRDDYNVLLSDEEEPWTQEHAYRLLETLRAIPQPVRNPYTPQQLPPSKWVLTTSSLTDDLAVAHADGGDTVRVSAAAFTYATPRHVVLDGERGTFYSKRLHQAVIRYVTRGGTDLAAVERILTGRFGCTTVVPDYAALTAATTHDASGSFQAFHPEELVQILQMFEEMPSGFHAIPGLRYLVRRKDGMPHPLYHEAPAVAWAALPGESYIEFMESGFNNDPDYTHRLILHEKAHFLWARVLSASLKAEWSALGGWAPDSGAPSGWSTTDTTAFVSPYAHAKNPDEDMAESISYFVLDPALLQSRAPAKFAFIRDRIMHGTRYLSQIRNDLTFEVLNLYPDYTYPGKIVRVAIRVDGAPEADKHVTVEIGLHTAANTFEGASLAYFRLFSDIGTYLDVYLQPATADGSVLRGEFDISRFAKAGFWRPDQIVVTDAVGNQRLEGVHDYGWKLYIANPLEDLGPPRYVPGSLSLTRSDEVVIEHGASHAVQRVRATWLIDEDRAIASVYASLTASTGGYRLESWGTVTPGPSPGRFVATCTFDITEFHRSGDYGVPYVMMYDLAGNRGDQAFSSSPAHQPLVTVPITTAHPDVTPPEVNLDDDLQAGLHKILVSAAPTHPDHPDGETRVTIAYQARDDLSGVGVVSYRLLDPQGISHFQYHYHPNFYTLFFDGDPTGWSDYEIDVVLPAGSPPGTWGLQELAVRDKAGNLRGYNFVETLRFDVAP